MPVHRKYKIETAAAALQACRGNVAAAARQLGCHRSTVQNYANHSSTVAAVIEAGREEMVDLAEQRLWEAVDRGEPWAVALSLKTVGKRRGYTERTELAGADEAPIRFTLAIPPPGETFDALPEGTH